jgi:PPM family protein phosphatase
VAEAAVAPDTRAITKSGNYPLAKPEIDVFGATHIGKVRPINQDHFVVATVHKRLDVHASSLIDLSNLGDGDDRLATLAAVADGVGSGVGGEQASKHVVEHMLGYLGHTRRCYEMHDETADSFVNDLQRAAMTCHVELVGRRHEDPSLTGLSTTLTLVLGVWPWIYVLQTGDSRYYLYREGVLKQVTRDQTLAQELVDQGVLSRAEAPHSMLANVLSSSIGGPESEPVVTRIRSDWRNVHLLCSDGLTKHVPDEHIAARLRDMTSARQVCQALVQDALDDGGSDNITVVIGRAVPHQA